MPLTTSCDACNSRGIVPRARRIINGAPDPFDCQIEELCMKCAGSGRIPDAGPQVAPAPAIDHNDCCV